MRQLITPYREIPQVLLQSWRQLLRQRRAVCQRPCQGDHGLAIRELWWSRPHDKCLSRKHIVEGLRASLRCLDTDYVVVYCHEPDPMTSIEETVTAMNYPIEKGCAFYWGTEEWSMQQITEACGVAHRLDLVGPIVE